MTEKPSKHRQTTFYEQEQFRDIAKELDKMKAAMRSIRKDMRKSQKQLRLGESQ